MSTIDNEISSAIGSFTHDPYGYVLYAFPWGVPGSELEHHTGPRDWQRIELNELGEQLRKGQVTTHEAILRAISSGHGIGKSCFVAWLILWSMSTFEDCKGVVTANTENQLKTKTWSEVAKWHRLAINSHWFKFTATAMFSTDPYHEKTWRIDMVPWSERNTEAFAGLHNEGKRILIIFDEASAIIDNIWEVTEGALTDENTEIIWCVFGNPTRNVGRFRECFRRYRHRWTHKAIDSRNVVGTNKNQHKKWIEDYGIESDFVKVRILGQFPSASDMQLISSALIQAAMTKQPYFMPDDPLIMTIDVARGGADNCVIRYRRGQHGYPIQKIKLLGTEMRDSMKFAAIIARAADLRHPDAIFIDATGVGGPVGDRLRQLGYVCQDIQFGAKSPDPKYANMRAYMYMKLEMALRDGLAIENDSDLETELLAIEYTHDKHDRIILYPKEKIKAEIGVSPDDSDSLAMSYAYPVAPTSNTKYGEEGNSHQSDYDPLGG